MSEAFGVGVVPNRPVVTGENDKGVFGELAEKSLTLLGSIIVASSHYKNYKACKELACECHE